MADLPSTILKMNDLEIAANKPLSTATFRKMGENINGLIDEDVNLQNQITAITNTNLVFGTSTGTGGALTASVTITGVTSGIVMVSLQGDGTLSSNRTRVFINQELRISRGATVLSAQAGTAVAEHVNLTHIDNAAGTGSITYTWTTDAANGLRSVRAVAWEIRT